MYIEMGGPRYSEPDDWLQLTVLRVLVMWAAFMHVHTVRIEEMHSSARKLLKTFAPNEQANISTLMFSICVLVRNLSQWFSACKLFFERRLARRNAADNRDGVILVNRDPDQEPNVKRTRAQSLCDTESKHFVGSETTGQLSH